MVGNFWREHFPPSYFPLVFYSIFFNTLLEIKLYSLTTLKYFIYLHLSTKIHLTTPENVSRLYFFLKRQKFLSCHFPTPLSPKMFFIITKTYSQKWDKRKILFKCLQSTKNANFFYCSLVETIKFIFHLLYIILFPCISLCIKVV
jgi:hypothetical protein